MRTHVNLASTVNIPFTIKTVFRIYRQGPELRNFGNISALLYTHNLLLGVLVGGQQVDCLDLAEVDVVAEQEYKQQLAHIFLLLVTIQSLVALPQIRFRSQQVTDTLG